MSTVTTLFQHRCCLCRKYGVDIGASLPWIHPVCARVICSQCQSPNQWQGPHQPCPDSMCWYHRNENKATKLCHWPALHPQGSRILAPALPILMMSQGTTPLTKSKTVDNSSDLDHSPSPSTSNLVSPYKMCGNCHKQGESHSIRANDLECMIGMCFHCFGVPIGHEDHVRDKVVRLIDKDVILADLLRKLTGVLTAEVENRIASAHYSNYVLKSIHQRGAVEVEESKALSVTVKPVTQSFFERMAQLKTCGYTSLSIYHDLQQAYNKIMTMLKTREKSSESTSTSLIPSLSSTELDSTPTLGDTKIAQFLRNEGKQGIEDVLSRLEGMVAQRMILSDTLDCVIKLLDLPLSILDADESEGEGEGEGEEKEKDDEVERTKVIQTALESLDLSCPQVISKSVIIVKTLMGIRGVIDGDDVSLELDKDGLEVLGLKEGVNELIKACQSVYEHLQSPQEEGEVETIKCNFTQVCDKLSKMLSIETVYSAMEQALTQYGAEKYLKEGLQYMLGEGGKVYNGAKAFIAFDLAMSLGSKEAMFRKAQLLFDGRTGVKRDATLAVTLFEQLKKEGLYLPQIYYYLSKHVLERSHGRTPEIYRLVSEYFTKIIEMKYDDGNNMTKKNKEEEEEEEEEEKKKKEEEEEEAGKGGDEVKVDGMDDGQDGGQCDDRVNNTINEKQECDEKKAAVLFAQAGVFYLYWRVSHGLTPYFRRQLPPSVRHWLRDCDMVKLCNQAIEAGCKEPELVFLLGYSSYISLDKEEGGSIIGILNKACALGVTSAYRILGGFYSPYYGTYVGYSKDPKKAMLYYLQAESMGCIEGGRLYRDIALLYWYREDEEKDGSKVLEYFDRAICYGDEESYDLKTYMYEQQSPPCPPISKCEKTAHNLRCEAEVAGCRHPGIFEGLSDDYVYGRGVDRDGIKAVQYLEKSIEYGKPRMYQWLGWLYDTSAHRSLPLLATDDSKALSYYLKEVMMAKDEDGFELEPYKRWLFEVIGSMYAEGRGTSIDHNKAVEYYTMAAEYYKKLGDKDAFSRLGALYDIARDDRPCPFKDDKEARNYYEAALELDPNDANILTRLGNMYRDGRGGGIDEAKALQCYNKALSLGETDALYEKALIARPAKKKCPPLLMVDQQDAVAEDEKADNDEADEDEAEEAGVAGASLIQRAITYLEQANQAQKEGQQAGGEEAEESGTKKVGLLEVPMFRDVLEASSRVYQAMKRQKKDLRLGLRNILTNIGTERKSVIGNEGDSNMIDNDEKVEGNEPVKLAIDTLLYEAGCPRRLTRKAVILIQDLDMAAHTEALLLKGIHAFYYGGKAYEYFADAEERGLTHPLLDYYLYQCYRLGDKGVTRDIPLANKYYDKYANAGIPYGAGLQALVSNPDAVVEAKEKLGNLVKKGSNLGSVYEHLGVVDFPNCDYRQQKFGSEWTQQASQYGNYMLSHWAYLVDFKDARGDYGWIAASLEPLIKAEIRGCKDDRILSSLVETLMLLGELSITQLSAFQDPIENGFEGRDEEDAGRHGWNITPLGDDDTIFDCDDCGHRNLPNLFPEYVGEELDTEDCNENLRFYILKQKFRTRETMALYYARVLIKRGSPEGYLRLGELYWKGMTHIPRNEKKAVVVWLEAERLNMATFETYMAGLYVAYMNGLGGLEVDGEKALECCTKALSVARTVEDKVLVYKRMAEVYERGIPPIAKDDVKAAEFKAKAGLTE